MLCVCGVCVCVLQFPVSALREIMLLKRLKHQNVIRLIEVVKSEPNKELQPQENSSDNSRSEVVSSCSASHPELAYYMVLEYVPYDLSVVLGRRCGVGFPESVVKDLAWQLFEALRYCHSLGVVHRDVKPSNMLLGADGTLKLIDFGLAKYCDTSKVMSMSVVTLRYRAPEVLLGDLAYSFPVDVWSAGCVVAELFLGTPLFAARSEAALLDAIIAKCGLMTEENWPGVSRLPEYAAVNKMYPSAATTAVKRPENALFDLYATVIPHGALSLIKNALTYNPPARLTAAAALRDPWFSAGIPRQKLLFSD